MPDMEDKEGEVHTLYAYLSFYSADKTFQTALHKAALNGHLSVVKYLLPDRADVHCQDADGWTALHNACSKVFMIFLDLLSVHPISQL
jgi:ankyrin repeat protein